MQPHPDQRMYEQVLYHCRLQQTHFESYCGRIRSSSHSKRGLSSYQRSWLCRTKPWLAWGHSSVALMLFFSFS